LFTRDNNDDAYGRSKISRAIQRGKNDLNNFVRTAASSKRNALISLFAMVIIVLMLNMWFTGDELLFGTCKENASFVLLPEVAVVTASSSSHFDRLENLVGSLQEHAPNLKIIVYDIGMTPEQKKEASRWCQVEVKRLINYHLYPEQVRDNSLRAFKPVIWYFESLFTKTIIWMDASLELRESLKVILDTVERKGYWLTTNNIPLCDKTHDGTLAKLGVLKSTFADCDSPLIDTRLMAFRNNSQFRALVLVGSYRLTVDFPDTIAPEGATHDNHSFDSSLITTFALRSDEHFSFEHTPTISKMTPETAVKGKGHPVKGVVHRGANSHKPFASHIHRCC